MWAVRMGVLDLAVALLVGIHLCKANMPGAAPDAAQVQETFEPGAAPDMAEGLGATRPSMVSDAAQAGDTRAAEADEDVREGAKRIALTFDDGPHPRYTEELLDGLEQRGVKATFFITGANAEKYPEIVKEIAAGGHLIGNHTYHHIQLTAANAEQFREEIISTNETIKKITGQDTEFIRPPYGSWNKKYEEELNMFPVLWTVDPRDWCSDNTACIVKNTVARVKENDIILLHDQYPSSIAAALEIVDELQKEGYQFVTVDEILFD